MIKSFATTLAAAAISLPTMLPAQQSFAAPEGCTPKLTVQHKSCVMVNVWTCEADDAGDQWIALIGQAGVFSIQKVDDEFQWLEAYKTDGAEFLETPADDPASLTELFATQIDTWDFVINNDDGFERNVGFDMLTGETVEIDGETLLVTSFEGRTTDQDGVLIDESAGQQFVSETHRLFFFGQAWDAASPDDVIDMSPLEFIYPDEAGFFSAQPKYECNVNEAAFRP